jgi:hypothetical protein
MKLERQTRLTMSAEVHFRQFDDEAILLDLASGEYYALNAVGSRMWLALASGRSPEEIASELGPDYSVDAEIIVRDCIELATDLLAKGFAQIRLPP